MKGRIAYLEFFSNDSSLRETTQHVLEPSDSLESAADAIVRALAWSGVSISVGAWIKGEDHQTCAVFATDADRDGGSPPIARIKVQLEK